MNARWQVNLPHHSFYIANKMLYRIVASAEQNNFIHDIKKIWAISIIVSVSLRQFQAQKSSFLFQLQQHKYTESVQKVWSQKEERTIEM